MQGAYQIDYLPVGHGSSAGDAICIRYSGDNSFRDQKVIVIDGGYTENGAEIISHIQRYYKTDSIDLVVATHSDSDHCLGLKTVLQNCDVKLLWMHKPWEHSVEIRDAFHDGRITDSSLEKRLRESFNVVHDIEQIALDKEINVIEPFSGLSFDAGILRVLGPTKEYYQQLIIQSPKTPQAKTTLGDAVEFAQGIMEKVIEKFDDWTTELLKNPPENATSEINNTSAILWFNWAGKSALFTADAGVPALNNALEYSISKGYDITAPNFLHCPHHGSRRNIGPTLLNQFTLENTSVIISCPPDGRPKHPSQRVINAFNRRGAKVMQTAGVGIIHQYNAPREGWNREVPLLGFVEDVTDEIESQQGE